MGGLQSWREVDSWRQRGGQDVEAPQQAVSELQQEVSGLVLPLWGERPPAIHLLVQVLRF